MNKKAFERPEMGIFYMVPDPKTGKYTLMSAYDEPGKDSSHFFFWPEIVRNLRVRFKKAAVDRIDDAYTGIPRGRVSTKSENEIIVLHGNDFPLLEYKSDIMSEFKLQDTDSVGKLSWGVEAHEKMGASEKKLVEDTLHIKMSEKGFKIL